MNATLSDDSAFLQALRQVVDPELGCNIVDLGFVYAISCESGRVTVEMTLTTPGCPMNESMTWGVQSAPLNVEGVNEVAVKLVWDPPWSPALMSAEARSRTGVSGGAMAAR